MTGEDSPPDDMDAVIPAELANLWNRIDGPPEGFSEQMRFAVAARGVDDELARLVEAVSLAARADDTPGTTWTFEAPSLTVMLFTERWSGAGRRVDGWLSPTAVRTVRLRRLEESLLDETVLETTADEAGRFRFSDVPEGLSQLIVPATEDRPGVVTPAFEL